MDLKILTNLTQSHSRKYSFDVANAYSNPYTVLGVEKTASDSDIKSAYRKLAMKYHPDRNPNDEQAEEKFKEVSEAYATLRDPDLRARFDRFGQVGGSRAGSSQGGFGGAGGYVPPDFQGYDWQTLFSETGVNIDLGQRFGQEGVPKTGNLMFDMLFSQVAGMATNTLRQNGLMKGESYETSIHLSIKEAKTSTVKRVRIPKKETEVDVTVPAGVTPGTKLRLAGQGGQGNPMGDVYVVIKLDVPMGIEVEGNNLLAELNVTPLEAEKGLKTSILDTQIELPANSKDGDVLQIAGAGLADGDLIVTVKTTVWKGLFRKARDFLGA